MHRQQLIVCYAIWEVRFLPTFRFRQRQRCLIWALKYTRSMRCLTVSLNCKGGWTMPTASSTIIRQFEKLQSKVADRCRSSDTWVCPDPVTLSAQADLILDDWQQEVCLSTSSRISLNCSRQVGKSTVTSVLAMHT